MGYAAGHADTEKIVLTDQNYWVEILTCLPRKALKRAEAAMSQAVVKQGKTQEDTEVSMSPDMAGYRDLMVLGSIASWNLDGDDGQILPIDLDGVGVLSGPDFNLIYKRVDALNSPLTPEAQQKFPGQG